MQDESLSGQLNALANRAEALYSLIPYEDGLPGRSPTDRLANIIFEAQVLLSGTPQFSLFVHRLNVLSATYAPQFLQVASVLFLAAKHAANPNPTSDFAIASPPVKPNFIEQSRIDSVQKNNSQKNFDVSRLVRLCEELNSSFAAGNLMATAMLLRAIKDHCPPIFGQKNFASVVAQLPGRKDSSTKKQLQRLEDSLKDVADKHLHSQISSHEALPTLSQIVSFQPETDALLVEISRALGSTPVGSLDEQ